MRDRSNPSGDLLKSWQWAAITFVVLVVAVVVIVSSSPPKATDDGAAADGPAATAEVVHPLGMRGSANGEGLTRSELTAETGLTGTEDGGAEVPTATIDGPGRRLFGGVTVRLPGGRAPFLLRQIVPEDIDASPEGGGVVKWDGYVAVLGGRGSADRLPARLPWQKAEAGGVRVPAGSVVRLRTMFRITDAAGRCSGSTSTNRRTASRVAERVVRAPAWMVRASGGRTPWQWLRGTADATSADLPVVRSGPTGPVVFRGSRLCAEPQTSTTSDPDLTAETTRTPGGAALPSDAPGGR